MGFPGASAGKESTCSAGDMGWEDPLEKGIVTQSSILEAWNIPWTEEPGVGATVHRASETQTRLNN